MLPPPAGCDRRAARRRARRRHDGRALPLAGLAAVAAAPRRGRRRGGGPARRDLARRAGRDASASRKPEEGKSLLARRAGRAAAAASLAWPATRLVWVPTTGELRALRQATRLADVLLPVPPQAGLRARPTVTVLPVAGGDALAERCRLGRDRRLPRAVLLGGWGDQHRRGRPGRAAELAAAADDLRAGARAATYTGLGAVLGGETAGRSGQERRPARSWPR